MTIGYEEFKGINSTTSKIMPDYAYDYIFKCSDHTGNVLEKKWAKNIKSNASLLSKHGGIRRLEGFGIGKAMVGVGAGPSFNLNKGDLKNLFDFNSRYELRDQSFLIVATNHQFKPLLNEGIYPHFVLLLDATEHAYEQLCVKVPKLGKKSILIASIFADHRTLSEWDKRGGKIYFYLPDSEQAVSSFTSVSKKDIDEFTMPSCGNVLNMAWMMSLQIFGNTVFMAVGADYSFDYGDIEKRRKSMYADGEADVDSERLQIKDDMAWQGFRFEENDSVIMNKPMINLELVGTSRQMFLYKLWTEMQMAIWQNMDQSFSYINCSEQGVLGVMANSWDIADLYERNNWYLLDELLPNYHTMRLNTAVTLFQRSKVWMGSEKLPCAENAGVVLPLRMDSAKTAAPLLM